ncbi:MAG: diguanylate cyclase [Desulfovibrio sp.]|nr:diguanylate cyclase [Desulfovibrio sp.]|tara:strand:- start:10303 stop:11796 length:1494 start_codon:yes stop_codon:yes gene_type:complete
MDIRGSVPGVRTGKISELSPLDSGKHSHLLVALARGAEALSSSKGWPDGVSELIADLGQTTGVSRVWLFQVLELTDKHMLMNFPFEWVDENTHALKKMGRYDTKYWNFETCSVTYRTLVASRRRKEWQTAIIHELDESDFKDYQMDQGVQSTLSVPVYVQGEWWGLLGLDDSTRPYQWKDEEISLVRMAAHLISSAVILDRLNSANRQFEILSNLTESNAWELDINSGYCWCDARIISGVSGLSDNVHLSILQVLRRIHPEDRGGLFYYLRNQLKRGELTFRQDMRILRDNEYVWSEVIAKISVDAKGRLQKMAGIAIDIPERKEKEEQLVREANLDMLTGVANRGAFDNRLKQMIRRFEVDGTVFSLLLMDVDHFKAVNDTWGHGIGDMALKHVSQIMQKTMRDGDFVARIGGEEFAMLVHCVEPETAEMIGERIRHNIEASPLITPEVTVPLSVSIGIFNVSSESSPSDCESMLRRADIALYQAKSTGRNKVVTC